MVSGEKSIYEKEEVCGKGKRVMNEGEEVGEQL